MKAYDVTLTSGIRSMKRIPLPIKLSIVERILLKGTERLEVTSFENTTQFDDREELIKSLPKGPKYYASVVNPYGFDLLRKYHPTVKGVSVKTSLLGAYKAMSDGISLFSDIRYILNDNNIKSRVYIDESGFTDIELPIKYYLPDITKQLFSTGADEVVLYRPSVYVLDELKDFKSRIGVICDGSESVKRVAEKGIESIDVSLLSGKDDIKIIGYESLQTL